MSWRQINDGKTVGQKGSEGGEIIFDEEHEHGARITLEKIILQPGNYFAIKPDGSLAQAPETSQPKIYFAVTCGIYGWFFHTHYISPETEALSNYEDMKSELYGILKLIPTVEESNDEKMMKVSDEISKFVDKFQ